MPHPAPFFALCFTMVTVGGKSSRQKEATRSAFCYMFMPASCVGVSKARNTLCFHEDHGGTATTLADLGLAGAKMVAVDSRLCFTCKKKEVNNVPN